MNTEKKNLKYSYLPKQLFIIFVIFGCLFIWISKFFNIPQIIITIIAVSLIPSYCYIALNKKIFFVKEDQIGDNAYYMGFLFTLSSLSFALFNLKTQSDNNTKQVFEIVSSFGIALWSTIAGIACRIYIAQLRQDIDDIEEDVKIKLLETANRVTNELHHVIYDFNVFTTSLKNSIEESYKVVNEQIESNLIKISNNLTSQIEKNIEKNNTIFENFQKSGNILNGELMALFMSFKQMINKIENIEVPSEVFARKVEEVFTEIKLVMRNSKKISEEQNLANAENLKNAKSLNDSFNNLRISIEKTNEEFIKFKQHKNSSYNDILTQFKETKEVLTSLVNLSDTQNENDDRNFNLINNSLVKIESKLTINNDSEVNLVNNSLKNIENILNQIKASISENNKSFFNKLINK